MGIGALILVLLLTTLLTAADLPPYPFTRELSYQEPMMVGNDVKIAQFMLLRDPTVHKYMEKNLTVTGNFGPVTATATRIFQNAHNLHLSGVFDRETAALAVKLYSDDGVKDDGFTAGSKGYKYKFNLPVHRNRSIETVGTLFDADKNVLLKFTMRSHGIRNNNQQVGWPDFGTTPGDFGLTQFYSCGATPTGIVEVDLNTPEPDPIKFGVWPINRVVRGLQGNAALLLPNIRDGILIHTGTWTTPEHPWAPPQPMPNSLGCLHLYADDIKRIAEILPKIGVKINKNPESGKNYPYKPQGIAVIELVD